jgi:hypothetical protein
MRNALLTLAILTCSLGGCSVKDDGDKARAAADAENAALKKEITELKAQIAALKGGGGQQPAKDHGGMEPQVVAAWEKAGAQFGWFTDADLGVAGTAGPVVKFGGEVVPPMSRVRAEKPAGELALPSFAMKVWPPAGGLEMLPKPTTPFGLSCVNLPVTDGWLKELAAFQQMQALDLNWTQVTDAGLKDLASLTKLQSLYLKHTPVTDAGLQELTALKQLYILDVGGTKVTNVGITELSKALPRLAVRK